MESVEADQMVSRLANAPDLAPAEIAEIVVTLAEHRDRRAVPVLIDLISSGRADTMVVRAAGLLAEPGLYPVLEKLAERRGTNASDSSNDEFWTQVMRAADRCHPGAAARADEVEIALLATTQASLLESGALGVDVGLEGNYPATEVVLRLGEYERRHAIWDFDDTNPDSPATLNLAFTRFRLGTLASWG